MNQSEKPVYTDTFQSGKYREKMDALDDMLDPCMLCPRECGARRRNGEEGFCGMGEEIRVASIGPHFGEERCLVGSGGSGTIFLSGCNLLCVFCQNYDISHLKYGRTVTPEQLGDMMILLQDRGCVNINLVTPTHFAPRLIFSLKYAFERGLLLPLVWNCGGYEKSEVIKLLDGFVDIYMPDFKYGTSTAGADYSRAPDYFERCCESITEMHRQVGDLRMDPRGRAVRGLLIRHLVMPGDRAGSENILRFVAELSPQTFLNIMSQYRPCGRACDYRELDRVPTEREFRNVLAMASGMGLNRSGKH